MNKYKIGLVCMIALSTLAMNTSDVNASNNNGINSSQVRSGEFDPTTSEYYVAPMSEAEYQAKWEAASIRGDTRDNQVFGGGQWYLDGDNLHIGEINLKNNGTSAASADKGTVSKDIIKTISGINESNINLYLDKEIDGKDYLFYQFEGKTIYGLNNIKANDAGDYSRMFGRSGKFSTDFKLFNTSNVTNMQQMFLDSQATELDVSNWNTSNVTDMSGMFSDSKVTNLDVSGWDTGNVTNMSSMFSGSQVINLDVSGWNTSKVTSMGYMFNNSKVSNLDVSEWDTSNVTNMGYMFNNSQVTNLDVSGWSTSKVTSMGYMFNNSKVSNLDVSEWKTGNVTDMNSMFKQSQVTNLNVSGWNTGNVTNMSYMFYSSKVTELDVSNWNTGNVTNMRSMFYNSRVTNLDVSNWSTSNVTNMEYMFYNSKVTELDVSNWITAKVTTMECMFYNSKVTELDVSNWITAKVTTMKEMFYGSQVTTLDVSEWDTNKVATMYKMFDSSKVSNLDVSNWNTSKVTNMGSMFYNINNIETLKLGGFNKDAPISDNNRRLSLTSTNKVDNIDFTGFNFDETHLHSISTPNIQTMTINETIYQPGRASSPFDLDKFPKNWRLASDHSITATSDELHTSTVVKDNPGLWEVYTPTHLSLSTSTPLIAFNDVKLKSLNSKVVKLNLDYESSNGVILSQKANKDDNQFSLKRNSDNYNLSTISNEVYTSTETKAVEELEYELEFNPTKLGAADNSITWTLSYKI